MANTSDGLAPMELRRAAWVSVAVYAALAVGCGGGAGVGTARPGGSEGAVAARPGGSGGAVAARPGGSGGAVAARGGGSEGAGAARGGGSPPDFELDALTGETVRLGDYLGKHVVLLDFWATFCEPCLTSMPHLDAMYRKYRSEGLVVLGIALDGPDSMAQVRAEVKKLGISFPVLLDQETRVVGLYNPRASAPFSVLIGRDGKILVKREGYTTGDGAAVEADVRRALTAR